MDSIDFFDKREPREKGGKKLGSEWEGLKKEMTKPKKDKTNKKPDVLSAPDKGED